MWPDFTPDDRNIPIGNVSLSGGCGADKLDPSWEYSFTPTSAPGAGNVWLRAFRRPNFLQRVVLRLALGVVYRRIDWVGEKQRALANPQMILEDAK